MRMSVDSDLKRFGRHNAGGKLAGSGHMYLRRVLLVWACGMDSILVVRSLNVRMEVCSRWLTLGSAMTV
jgi:hypothetical protein